MLRECSGVRLGHGQEQRKAEETLCVTASRPRGSDDRGVPRVDLLSGTSIPETGADMLSTVIEPDLEPEAPDLAPLLAIHRHHDGRITFHRKGAAAGEFENLFALRPRDLSSLFQSPEALDRDSFFSINAFWDRNTTTPRLSAAEVRRSDRLRYLCAAFVDLDIYKVQLDFAAALAAVVRMEDEGRIPPASIIVRSGRGMWLLWLLHDSKDPGKPPGAYPEKLRLYDHINRAAGECLAHLGVDAGAHDAVRLMRVPGSTNPRAEQHPRVRYWLQADDSGRPYSYTLEDLAHHFGVGSRDSGRQRQPESIAVEAGIGAKRAGFTQTTARRLRELNALRLMRGGFAEGCRNRAVLIYAWLMRCSRLPAERILRECRELAAECRPPLSDTETRQAVKTATNRKFKRFRDQTISDWLGITPGESAQLEKLPASPQFRLDHRQESRQQERRDAIRQILEEHESRPSCREMVRLLRDRQIQVSAMQVSRDYKMLRSEPL